MATLSSEVKQQIQATGFGTIEYIGGIKKQRYWTPDGREIFSVPSMREYRKVNAKGNVIETGVRDANLDKGWLLTPPTEPKLYCGGCDNWHDTKDDINTCIKQRKQIIARELKRVKGKVDEKGSNFELTRLKTEVSELKNMIQRLLREKGND